MNTIEQIKQCPYDKNQYCEANCATCALHKKVKQLNHIYKQIITLEYILDSTNQKRKRKDKKVKKAWGHAFNIKGEIIRFLEYYQPTLPLYIDHAKRTKINPTWTKNSKKVYNIIKKNGGNTKIAS